MIMGKCFNVGIAVNFNIILIHFSFMYSSMTCKVDLKNMFMFMYVFVSMPALYFNDRNATRVAKTKPIVFLNSLAMERSVQTNITEFTMSLL